MSATPRDRSLLTKIERAALDETTSVATALRHCLALGGRANSTALRDWASKELQGYGPDKLPAYRMVPATIRIDFANIRFHVRGHRISPHDLPDVVREHVAETLPLGMGIGELEALARRPDSKELRFSLPGGAEIAALMNLGIGDRYQHIQEVYWSVSPVTLRGVADQVRTTLVALVAELAAAMPDDQDVPSRELADQVVGVVIHGAPRSTYHLNNAQATGGGHSTVTVSGPEPAGDNPGRKRWRLVASVVGGLAAFASMIAGLGQWLGWRLPWR